MWCFVADCEEGVDALAEAGGVLLPEEIVEEDAHGVHADGFGPAEFGIDALWIEGVRLPHLELVDGVGGDVVAADEPGLLGVPGIGLVFSPAFGRTGSGGEREEYEKWNSELREMPRFHRGHRN